MKSEFCRLATFCQANLGNVCINRLARVGFFYNNVEKERIVCFSCQLPLDPCQLDVDCQELHRKLSPHCSFLNKEDDQNVGLNKEPWKECGAESINESITPYPSHNSTTQKRSTDCRDGFPLSDDKPQKTKDPISDLSNIKPFQTNNVDSAFHCKSHCKSLSVAILKSSIWTVYVEARTRADRRNVFVDLDSNRFGNELEHGAIASEKGATLCESSNLQPLDTSTRSQESSNASRENGLHPCNEGMLVGKRNYVSFDRGIGKCSESKLSTNQAAVSINHSAAFVQQPAASINHSAVSIGLSAPSIRQPAVSIQDAPFSNYPVQTPVTAPIDRTKPDFDLLRRESVRLSTYHDWPQTAKIQPLVLAKEGFFYIGFNDRVQCVFCREYLRNWVVGDDPSREHSRHFPNCPFVRRRDCQNIPDVSNPSKPDGQPRRQLQPDLFHAPSQADRPSYTSATTEHRQVSY